MMRKYLAAAAAASMAASPCLAAEIPAMRDTGARQSGAVAAAYFKVPLGGGGQAAKAHGGLKLAMVHDYRTAGAQTARVVSADTLDLRLVGEKKPALFVAGQKLSGDGKRSNLTGVSTIVTVTIVAAAVVAGFYLARAIDDSGEE
jgi:hypothetical protein